MKKAVVMVAAMLVVVACGHNDTPSSPSQVSQDSSSALGGMPGATLTSPATPLLPRSQSRIGFGFNGTVSGFPTGEVFLTGGGAYQRESHFVAATGVFRCILAVLQGPLSTSINPNDPGAWNAGQPFKSGLPSVDGNNERSEFCGSHRLALRVSLLTIVSSRSQHMPIY